MAAIFDVTSTCCVALELSKTSWVMAFAPPGNSKVAVQKIKARDIDNLISFLNSSKLRAERELGRPLQIVLCYEAGYDGFWLARLLIEKGIPTVVFDPWRSLSGGWSRMASFRRVQC
jgi:transposase